MPKKQLNYEWLLERANYAHDHCLYWPFSRDNKGYGQVGINTKVRKAHRVMCEIVNGPPPAGYEAAHSCGRGHKGCVNPRHLSWQTRSQNQLDRRKHGTHGKPGCVGRNKLTPAEVAEMRSLKGKMTQLALAKRFNCTPTNVSKILSGARWQKTPVWLKHLEPTGGQSR